MVEPTVEDAAPEWTSMIAQALEDCGVDGIPAQALARRLVALLRHRHGGQGFHLPAEDRRTRNAAIRAAFNGNNRDEVCRQYSISKTTFYEVISGRRG